MLDDILAGLLIVAVPAWAMWRSLRAGGATTNRMRRYLVSGLLIAALLGLLCVDWLYARRTPSSLGLDMPLSRGGEVGLFIAGALFLFAAAAGVIHNLKGPATGNRKQGRRIEGDDILPRDRRELAAFLGLSLLLGGGWELLYRGFLLWFLVPLTGAVGAVFVAAVAYGAAHGYRGRRQFIGSIVSAFLFTIAFVLSGSLWWLMIVHTAAAVAGGLSSYRIASRTKAGLSPSLPISS